MISSNARKTATFKSVPLLEKDILITHLLNNPDVLTKDLKFLGPFTSMRNEFLLGVSGERRLQIIEVEKTFEERLLYRSLAHLQWALKNTVVWEKAAGQFQIDPAFMPGIVFVLPEWPAVFMETFGYLSPQIQIQAMQYWYIESESDHGFLFEPVEVKRISRLRVEKALSEVHIDSLKEQAGLTHAEIMKFLE